MEEIVALAPTGSLGSGFHAAAFQESLASDPDFIGVDCGSTDIGPFFITTNNFFHPLSTYKHDLAIMLAAAREREVPLILGTAFSSGTRGQLDRAVEVVKEIAAERGYGFRMAVIDAEIDKAFLKRRLAEGPFESLGPAGTFTAETIDRSPHIVGQMGVEPFMRALEAGAQVIVAGRACDDVIFAALPLIKGHDRGLALHMGKILECAGLSAVPGDLGEPMVGRIRDDHFEVTPGSHTHRCTTVSVAAHSLYERGDPCRQPGPGGVNELSHATYGQVNDRTVRVTGSRFEPDDVYRVKIEGGEQIGWRTVCMAGVRDEVMIGQIDNVTQDAHARVRERFADVCAPSDYQIHFHLYGKNAVMAGLEPVRDFRPLEIGIFIDIIAATQDLANAVCMYARASIMHASYPGIRTTAGNLAYPLSPFVVPVGPACRFSVYHLLPLADPCECFPMDIVKI